MKTRRILSLCSLVVVLWAVAGLASGCTLITTPVMPYTGTAFHSSTQPVDIRFDEGVDIGSRRGEAHSTAYLLYLVSMGDSSIMTAARNAGIRNIDHVECEVFNFLGLYVRYRTVVYGT